MALFNISKKSESEKKEEVPDELPDLPQAAENNQTMQNSNSTIPAELPPVELAPDELPPVGGLGVMPGSPLQDFDKRSYFSGVLQKLQEEGVKSTKLTASSANLLGDMKKHWKQVKKQGEIDAMKQKVLESLTPLQELEQEWISLQEDIEQKKRLLHEKEEKIRVLAEEARNLALKAEKTANQRKE